MPDIINRFSNPDAASNRGDSYAYYNSIPNDPSGQPIDFNSPLVFSDWLKYQKSIDPNNQYSIYLQYLIRWYGNSVNTTITTSVIYDSYLAVLESLALVFKNKIRDEWVRELNFENDIDVQDAIEFYARKLKEIAIYFINKRNDAQNAKLKYNMVGSEAGLQNLFTDYFLKAFSNRQYVLNLPDQESLENVPSLSAISNDAKIIIEPYYDTTNYFDKSPTTNVSAYFNTDDTDDFLASQDIDIDSSILFSSGILDNQYNSDPVTISLDLSGVSDSVNQVQFDNVLAQITKKYTGAIKQRLAIYETLNNVLTTVYDIEQGNNWFYWPTGEYVFEQNNLDVTPINLVDTDLINVATAAETYEEADKIFVTTNNDTTEAAWLKYTPSTISTQTLSAVINSSSRLIFKFPYPGYGDAAETLPWTGPSLTNINALYNFVDSNTQKQIEKAYFTNTTQFTALSVTPFDINDSTLINSALSAGDTYATSDKISRRNTNNPNRINDSTPSTVYNDILEHSWLYNFVKTDLSLNTGQTNILWPYVTYDTDPGISFSIGSDSCNVIELSSISPLSDIKESTAGRGLYDSDILYKLNGINSFAKECAYLSGIELSAANLPVTKFTAGIDGVLQPGLNIKCEPGIFSTFLWCGTNGVSLNSTNIKYHESPTDTNYRKLTQSSIYNDRNKPLEQIQRESSIAPETEFVDFGTGAGIGNWKSDDSRSVLFSPIGHPGDNLDEYDKMADIVFMDWAYPEPFSFESWRDENGLDYKSSPDFAWYQITSTLIHPDVGWGPGGWVNYDGTDAFTLKAGYQYKYLRTNLNRSEEEISNKAVPYLVINETFNQPASSFEWKYAELQQDATWLPTTSASNLKIAAGDAILYDHARTTSYCVSTEDTRGLRPIDLPPVTSSGDTSYWLDYESAPLGTIIVANWPSTYYNSASTLPTVLELSSVTWSLSTPESTVRTWDNLIPGVPISFTLSTPGTYTLSSSAIKLDGSEYSSDAISFPIVSYDNSLIFEASGTLSYNTVNYNNLAIKANIQLNGWDVDTASFTGTETGQAKPFWGKAYDSDDSYTKNKGISIYGTNLGFNNEYNKRFQPDIDSWDLISNNIIEIDHIGSNRITWVQDIETQEDNATTEWKQLIFSDISSPLNVFSDHDLKHLSISATDITSDIELTPYTKTCTGNVFINYFAQNSFTWTQPISTYFTDTITIVNSSLDTEPYTPYAYLTNRHYPTMAILPDISNLISVKDAGIFRPQALGYTNFFTKSHVQSLSTTTSISGVYLDINNYETDFGLTLETNPSVVNYLEYDAQWMKRGFTTIARSGQINNPSRYQKFTPYTNSSEYKIVDNVTINNDTDPWYGDLDKTWRDEEIFPIDFRGQETIETWYSETISPSGEIYQFCDDVHGNKYYLFKNLSNTPSIYDQRLLQGQLWVKTIDNKFGSAAKMLPEVIDNYTGRSYVSDITGSNIRDIYCYADIFTTVLSGAILFEKMQFNYAEGTIFSIVDDSNVIELNNSQFGDIHCNLENKYLYTVISNQTTCFEIYKLDINNTKLNKVFPSNKTDNLSLISSISALSAVSIDAPIFAYNKYTDSYNVSFFANATNGQHLISVGLNENYDHFDITKVDIVEPSS